MHASQPPAGAALEGRQPPASISTAWQADRRQPHRQAACHPSTDPSACHLSHAGHATYIRDNPQGQWSGQAQRGGESLTGGFYVGDGTPEGEEAAQRNAELNAYL